MVTTTGRAPTAPPPDQTAPPAWHTLQADEALVAQGVTASTGLTREEVERRRTQYGRNAFTRAEKEPGWKAFLRQYRDLMQLVLFGAALVSFFVIGEIGTAVLLISLTVFNAALGLNQEGKAEASVAALQKMMIVKAKARRGGEVVEVPMEELVPGDVVNLEAG